MALAETDTQMLELSTLLEGIAKGGVCLPDFQRDFDWGERHIRSLLATVLRGWPAGSLLLVRGGSKHFKVRNFEGAPPLSGETKFVVLDGQQRLTALYRALYGIGPYVYAIGFDDLSPNDIDSIEEKIIGVKTKVWQAKYALADQQLESRLVPLTALRSPTDFMEWRDGILKIASPVIHEQISASLLTVYKAVLGRMDSYQFPSILLEGKLDAAAVARIFERVNRTGLRLGTFDLAVARVYQPAWNLRQQWESARKLHPKLQHFFGDDGTPILQVISLYNSLDVRQTAVLGLQHSIISKSWMDALNATAEALDFLGTRCGVLNGELLPYPAQVLALAALSLDGRDLKKCADLLERWFWDRSFNLAFEVASNTRVVSDYRLLRDLTKKKQAVLPTTGPSMSDVIELTKRQSGAFFRTFMAAIVSNKPHDLIGGKFDLKFGSAKAFAFPAEYEILPVEIVPDIYSSKQTAVTLSFSVCSPENAEKIAADGWKKFIATISSDQGVDAVSVAMASQFLPPPAEFAAIKSQDKLLLARLNLLDQFLSSKTGASFVE
jgi:Protein of unknown function DUF262